MISEMVILVEQYPTHSEASLTIYSPFHANIKTQFPSNRVMSAYVCELVTFRQSELQIIRASYAKTLNTSLTGVEASNMCWLLWPSLQSTMITKDNKFGSEHNCTVNGSK